MTNEHGKSDKPILPEKSSNKAGTSAAEGAEGRGLAKGNLRQQNAFRTQCRGDVHSALQRVREAAKKNKGTRSTALFHYVYDLDMLKFAFFRLKKEAAPAWTERRGGTRLRASKRTSGISPIDCGEERITRSRCVGHTYRRATGGSARSA